MRELTRLMIDEGVNQIEEIGKMELGTEQYKIATDGLSKLNNNIIESKRLELENKKIEYEFEEKMKAHEVELMKLENERKERLSRGLVDGCKTVGTMLFIYNLSKDFLKFEETGTFSSSQSRKLSSLFWNFLKF